MAHSSCRLEAEAHRNIEVIWLLRHLKPDFRIIAAYIDAQFVDALAKRA